MKKVFLILSLGMIFLCGCLVRTYTIYKPRKGTEIKGNQGYIMGAPSEEEKKKESRLGEKRPLTVIEIELGSHPPEVTPRHPQVSGEQVQEENKAEEEVRQETKVEADETPVSAIEEEINREEIPVKSIVSSSMKEQPQKEYKYYVVLKNDTLQKISYKFYGTTRKWKLIYEENKNVIKNPDRLYPGTKIKIPF